MLLKKDPLNLIIAGVGGQGNILLSRLMGSCLVAKDYFVTIGETYGAAQRGGAVMSHLRISKKMQQSPLIPEGKGDVILALEPVEAIRVIGPYGNPEVIVVANSRPTPPLDVMIGNAEYPSLKLMRSILTELSQQVFIVDASDAAISFGKPILANIIMLGALLNLNILPISANDIKPMLQKSFPDEAFEINLRALQAGIDAFEKT